MKKDNRSKVSEIVMDFRNNCEAKFIEIKDVYWDVGVKNEEEVFEVHVEVKESKGGIDSSTYTYPIADFGRERGLYLWDTVTDWREETVTLRFRFDE